MIGISYKLHRQGSYFLLDVKLRLSGLGGVRIWDAGVFLEMRIANPMLTVLPIGKGLLRRLQRRLISGRWKKGKCESIRCGRMVKLRHNINMAFTAQNSSFQNLKMLQFSEKLGRYICNLCHYIFDTDVGRYYFCTSVCKKAIIVLLTKPALSSYQVYARQALWRAQLLSQAGQATLSRLRIFCPLRTPSLAAFL